MKRSTSASWAIGAAVAVCVVGGVALGLRFGQLGSGAGSAHAISSTGRRLPAAAPPGSTTSLPAAPARAGRAAGNYDAATAAAPAAAPAAATPATTAPAHRPAATTTAVAPATDPGATTLGPPAAGTYRYRQAGSLPGTPAEGTLVVTAAGTPGTQNWTRNVGGPVAASTRVMLFNASGSFLIAPGGTGVGAPDSCSFLTPLPWPPWPVTVGKTVSGHASCSGPLSTYEVTESIPSTAAISFGGSTVHAAVVVNMIVITGTYSGSPLRVTLTETDEYAPTLRIPITTTIHLVGSVLGLSVTTDRTDTLESATPA